EIRNVTGVQTCALPICHGLLFGEPELATVTLRLLTEIARADPEIFRRRFADRTVIAALFWITAKNNDLFPRPGGNPTAMTIGGQIGRASCRAGGVRAGG